jgi:hypothetical protein
MRKPIIMESRGLDETWPEKEIDIAIENLFNYLSKEYVPEEYKYSKYALMGPVSKLLNALVGEQFGSNISSYLGFIANIHLQQSMKSLTPDGYSKLETGIRTILEIKTQVSQRGFNRIIRAIDYGIFFKKAEEVAKKIEQKPKKVENSQ